MIDRDGRGAMDPLDRAAEALRDAPVPEGPPPGLVASTVQALQSSEIPPDDVRISQRRRLMVRMARYGGAGVAAAVLLALLGHFWFAEGRAHAAFADVIENVRKAQSVSFVFHQQLGGPPTLSSQWYVQGDAVRMEMPGQLVVIADVKQKKTVQLNLVEKVAEVSDIDAKTARQQAKRFTDPFANPVEYFGKLTAEDAEKTGEEELDGRKVDVYRLKRFWEIELEQGDDQSSITAWVDRKSGLPVRIAIRASFHAEGKSKDWLVLEEFKWNEPLDPDLFKLDIPEGYTVAEAPPSTQQAAQAAFADAIAKAERAGSVTCTVRSGMGDGPEITADLYAQAGAVCRKIPQIGVYVEDLKQGKAVQLLPVSKRAYRWDVAKQHAAELSRRFPNPAVLLRTVRSEDAEGMVPVRIDGQRLWQYQLKKVDLSSVTGEHDEGFETDLLFVFIDPQTRLPAEIRLFRRPRGESQAGVWYHWEDCQWGRRLDPDLFKLEIPEGYTVIEGEPTPEILAAEREAIAKLTAIEIDFGEVIENVNKAASVTCKVDSSQIDEPRAIGAHLYAQADAVRRESLVIQIEDRKQGRAVQFPNKLGFGPLPGRDQAYRWNLDKTRLTDMARRFPNPALLFRNMKSEDAEKVREARREGRKVAVYSLKSADVLAIMGEHEQVFETKLFVSVDPKTKLPARISLECTAPGEGAKAWFIWDDLEWNKPLDPGLFKLDIPRDYKVIDGPLPEGPPWPDLKELLGAKQAAGK